MHKKSPVCDTELFLCRYRNDHPLCLVHRNSVPVFSYNRNGVPVYLSGTEFRCTYPERSSSVLIRNGVPVYLSGTEFRCTYPERSSGVLPRKRYRPFLPDHRDPDLPGVLHLILNFL